MQAITGIASATISGCVLRVAQALGEMPLAPLNRSVLIVDATSARVASREAKAYSGYRHHRCAKVQVVTRKDGQIVDVSQSYPGSVHDKGIWNVEATRLLPMLRDKVLADKAYAGAAGEGSLLRRPIKRGETAWKLNMGLKDAKRRAFQGEGLHRTLLCQAEKLEGAQRIVPLPLDQAWGCGSDTGCCPQCRTPSRLIGIMKQP